MITSFFLNLHCTDARIFFVNIFAMHGFFFDKILKHGCITP